MSPTEALSLVVFIVIAFGGAVFVIRNMFGALDDYLSSQALEREAADLREMDIHTNDDPYYSS